MKMADTPLPRPRPPPRPPLPAGAGGGGIQASVYVFFDEISFTEKIIYRKFYTLQPAPLMSYDLPKKKI